MDQSNSLAVGLAGLAVAAIAGFAVYRWRQRARVRGVKAWVAAYLTDRYGTPPDDLAVNCSDDPLWPVLVAFAHPRTGAAHRLRFACAVQPASCTLLSETEGVA